MKLPKTRGRTTPGFFSYRKRELALELRENERLDDLQLNGLRIIQNTTHFCFGIDAVLLADFANISAQSSVLDLCCGNGIIPILLRGRNKGKRYTGIEIMPEAAELAVRNMQLNGIDAKIVCANLKECGNYFENGCFDAVTVNPPYQNGGFQNESNMLKMARHEISCTLEDIAAISSKMLKASGRLCMIHRPNRMAEVIYLMKQNHIELKRTRFVHPSVSKRPTMVLFEGIKGASPGVYADEPLYVYDENGSYTEEINRIYHREG